VKRWASTGIYPVMVALAQRLDDPDLELLARWRNGEAAAGEQLFSRHFPSLYRFFHNKVGAEADELVQTTLLACVTARDQFRAQSTFRTYMFAIARQKLYRFLSDRRRAALDPMTTSIAEVVTSVRTELVRDQTMRVLLDMLRRLPVDAQTLLELHYWEDLDTIELGKIFEAPPGTIRVWLHRARERLRDLLAEHAPDVAPQLEVFYSSTSSVPSRRGSGSDVDKRRSDVR
jgi:RNA polymerase sigma-70 factor (ECF subfamily)